MEERRLNKRTELQSKMIIKRVGGNEYKEAKIDIIDVSRCGIGFWCKDILGIGEVYEASMTIWTKEEIHVLLQIVRIELQDEEFVYGAAFVGLPEMEAARIEVYQTINENEESDYEV